jgi:hypothetical protein
LGIPLSPPPSQTPAKGDQANAVITGALVATGEDAQEITLYGVFNFAVWGTFVGTIQVEKTYDAGTTWIPVYSPFTGGALALTAPGSVSIGEGERGVSYRAHCTQYVSGTLNYRFSATGLMAQSAGVPTI